MIDLASASFRVEFTPGETDIHAMASIFADSVREASAAAVDGDGTPWWQPSTNWVALTAYPACRRCVALGNFGSRLRPDPGPPSRTGGRLRSAFQGRPGLSHLDGVEACKAIPWSHRLTIDFHPDHGVADWFIDEAERSFEHLVATEAQQAGPATLLAQTAQQRGGPIQVASGLARLLYLALGGAALVMTVVGVIVPGIPTVPFLLLSSYGFARSSPRINHWLRETRFLGPILTEWEHHGGLSRRSKRKLIGLTVVIVVIAIILAPLSPVGLILILIMASLSTYGVYRLPSSPEAPATAEPAQPSVRLALPAQ